MRRSKLRLPLYHAIHRMTLAAWKKREVAAAEAGEMLETPDFIRRMRSKLTDDGHVRPSVSTDSTSTDPTPSAFEWGLTGLTSTSTNNSTGYSNESNAGYYNTSINPTGESFLAIRAITWRPVPAATPPY